MPWLNYQTVTNRRWHSDDVVLMGNAAHATHSRWVGYEAGDRGCDCAAGRLQEHELQAALEAYGEERGRPATAGSQGAGQRQVVRERHHYIDLEARSSERCWLALPILSPVGAYASRAYYRLYEVAGLEVLQAAGWLSSGPGSTVVAVGEGRGRLGRRLDRDVVDVDARRARDGERDRLCDVVRHQ